MVMNWGMTHTHTTDGIYKYCNHMDATCISCHTHASYTGLSFLRDLLACQSQQKVRMELDYPPSLVLLR